MEENQVPEPDSVTIGRGLLIGIVLGAVMWIVILTAVFKYIF
ncbi:hypothetical protein [Paenibacillus swuensis]|nr:hypothetical protein [Paenibacillus swuensis]